MIDYNALQAELKALTTRKKLYKLLKEELSILGWWKNKARGKAVKGQFNMSREAEAEND